VDVRVLAFVKLRRELVLAQELCDATGGGDVAGRERCERLSTSPLAAMSWPFLSTMKTTRAFASFTKRSTTVWIWLNSSSYITICGFMRASENLLDAVQTMPP
jgi:hypothetical protein